MNQLIQAIGLTDGVYYLWNIVIEELFSFDTNTKRSIVGEKIMYNLIEEISSDLSIVEEKFSNLKILDILQNKNESWTANSEDTLEENVMSFGVFIHREIDELIETEFDYVVWLCDNTITKNSKYAKTKPKVKDFYDELIKRKNKIEQDRFDIFLEFLAVGTIDLFIEKDIKFVDENLAYYTYQNEGIVICFFFEKEIFSVLKDIKNKKVNFKYEKYHTEQNDEVPINLHVMVKEIEII